MVSIILAGGKGTRMQSPHTHKVCFPLDGRPVIARAVETYYRQGIESHFIVVGDKAEQVMQAASSAPGSHFFCYQPEQRGTGNAAKTAARPLAAMGYEGDVLVVAGDKVIEDSILVRLFDAFYESRSDLAFVVGEACDFPSSGRVVFDEGSRILGIVEVFDIARMQSLHELTAIARERPLPASEAESLALARLGQESKAELALGPLWERIKEGNPVTTEAIESSFSASDFVLRANGAELSTEILAAAEQVNLSVYLFRAPALYAALDRLTDDNAQQEEYLTDTVAILAADGRSLRTVAVDSPREVMAFNTPAELKEIEAYLRARERVIVRQAPKSVRPVREWRHCFETADDDSTRYLSRMYGEAHPDVESKRRTVVSMLHAYERRFGNQDALISRAPGRVNIMGRHADHQGGHVNMIAIDRDVFMVIGLRSDRRIYVHNLDSHQFPDREFDIDDLMTDWRGGEWLDFVNSRAVRDRVAAAQGDWSQYVKAAVVRFQTRYPERQIRGMNIVTAGDIPVAAGLSSSSAIVVAATEGIVAINGLDVTDREFVELCGEGEWYVGTRGGAGDHAAMKFARMGHVVQMGFFPFRVADTVRFPEGYVFVVCDSHEKARKTAGARDVFNHRVACYHIGRELLKQEFPEFAPRIQHLRDFNIENLDVEYAQLLRMLKRLPVSLTRKDVAALIAPEKSEIYLSTHSEFFNSYPIRPVVMYGLAEFERGRLAPDLLRRGAIEEFGRWMNVSHNGDRVVTWDQGLNSWPYPADCSDRAIDALIAKLDWAPDEARLVLQPGAYSCSIPEIDRMVDIALSVDGVLGAQLAGAGLGGCIMVLAREDARKDLEDAMIRRYYEPADLEPEMFTCYPVAGSGVCSL